MSEQNKQIARRFIAAFMANDAATLTQVVAADVADHSRPPGQPPTDRQALSWTRSPPSSRASPTWTPPSTAKSSTATWWSSTA